MKPFLFNASASARLVARYPQPAELAFSYKALANDCREGIIRSFITEGIPYAFQGMPLLYEIARDFVAKRLGTEARQVTMVGSARLGYSLAPPPSFGHPFGPESDLDLTVFSKTLFDDLASDFASWEHDLAVGHIKRTGAAREKFWPENLRVVPSNLKRGFIDPYKIPKEYGRTGSVWQTVWFLQEKLKATQGAPKVHHVSVRVYQDWRAFVKQLSLNLEHSLRSVEV